MDSSTSTPDSQTDGTTVLRAGEIAVQHGYDFLIVTDHSRNPKLFTHRTLQEYIEACYLATTRLGRPVIPGGEMEVHWNDLVTTDLSEGHTLVLSAAKVPGAQEALKQATLAWNVAVQGMAKNNFNDPGYGDEVKQWAKLVASYLMVALDALGS